jgi:hypothetical protein
MSWGERFQKAVFANPLAWFLFAIFLVAEYANWQHEKKLERVCELTGPHDVTVGNPTTDREELDNICAEALAESTTRRSLRLRCSGNMIEFRRSLTYWGRIAITKIIFR